MTAYEFPEGFIWGAATASYQIEGAAAEDGRSSSIWDDFCKLPGRVRDGQSGREACNHYHMWEADLDLMAELGLKAYRFSVAWPRVVPGGMGAVNPKGLDFYERLVDGLLERGIQPFATLYHWDLPCTLEAKGGWRNRDTAQAFADYSATVAARLGDRVAAWATFNELHCVVDLGHRSGEHAPGAREPEQVIRQLTHHLLLGHGLAVRAVRAATPGARVGLVHNPGPSIPISETCEHIEAARQWFISKNGWMMEPLFRGQYPADEWERLADAVPRVADGDLAIINEPLDFLGLNVYGATIVRGPEPQEIPHSPGFPASDMGWAITPDCVYWIVRHCAELYPVPREIYITENGCACADQVDQRGEVNDTARIEYLKGHIRAIHRATVERLPLKGYFVWSLMDNFEWGFGYTKRFGIVHVAYETQKRTPKMSAHWYSQVIRDNGL
jgi:beta-glucosidase